MVEVNEKRCDLCGTCVSVCRRDAIVIYTESLAVNQNCSGCGLCIRVCPFGALSLRVERNGFENSYRETSGRYNEEL